MSSTAGLQANYMAQQNAIPTIPKNSSKEELRQRTDEFEAIILKMVMDNALKDEKNIFTQANDPGDKIYNSMYRDELTKASAGGFGFSQMLFEYLSQKQE